MHRLLILVAALVQLCDSIRNHHFLKSVCGPRNARNSYFFVRVLTAAGLRHML